jgi:prepilin-type N-terminal cleavage/methylation domain-containing protein
MKFAKFAARLHKKGFTLIELIVVIAILAILAVTAMMAVSNVTQAARDATLRADANTVIRALNIYNMLCFPDDRISGADFAGITAAELGDLEIEAGAAASAGMIDADFSVDITDDRLAELKAANVILYGVDATTDDATEGLSFRLNETIF